MANLNGQNIGTNYKGFLNLDSTINTPLDATLRAVTDGMGNSSAFQLSTTAVSMGSGTITSNGILTIKGSGGNILSLRDSSNVEKSYVNSDGQFSLAAGSTCADMILTLARIGTIYLSGNSFLKTPSSGIITLTDVTDTSFNRLQFGGTTSSFPAIKRNGAAIDFRLADDSGYADVNAKNVVTSGYVYSSTNGGRFGNVGINYGPFGLNAKEIAVSGDNLSICATTGTGVSIGTLTLNASAILQADSTTKGFLMPRMNTGEINAIATPANGLQVYNTDLAQPCFYDGAGWRKISHSAM